METMAHHVSLLFHLQRRNTVPGCHSRSLFSSKGAVPACLVNCNFVLQTRNLQPYISLVPAPLEPFMMARRKAANNRNAEQGGREREREREEREADSSFLFPLSFKTTSFLNTNKCFLSSAVTLFLGLILPLILETKPFLLHLKAITWKNKEIR